MNYKDYYLSWLNNVLNQYEIEINETLKLHLKGTILELICCLEYNNFIMYDNVNIEYKLKYNMPKYDNGIDIIDINNNIIGQCKYYKPKSFISDKILGSSSQSEDLTEALASGSFIRYIHNLSIYNFKYNLYLTKNVKCNFIRDIDIITIKDDKINYWINKSKEYNNKYIEENKDITINNIKLYYFQNEILNIINDSINNNKKSYYFNVFCG